MAVRMKTGALDVKGVDRWYVTDGSNSVGPVRLDLLTRGVEAGRVPLDSFVRHEAWKVWRPLTDFTDYIEEPLQFAPPLPQFPLPDAGGPRSSSSMSPPRQTPSKKASLAEFASAEGVPSRSSEEGFSTPGPGQVATPLPAAVAIWSHEDEIDAEVDEPDVAAPRGLNGTAAYPAAQPRSLEPHSLEAHPAAGRPAAGRQAERTDVSGDLLGKERAELLADFARTQKLPSNIAEMARPAPPTPPSGDTLVRPSPIEAAGSYPFENAETLIVDEVPTASSMGAELDESMSSVSMSGDSMSGVSAAAAPAAPPSEPAEGEGRLTIPSGESLLVPAHAEGAPVSPVEVVKAFAHGTPVLRRSLTDDIPSSEHGNEGWGAARPADSADSLPDDELTGAGDLSDALLLLLGGIVKRTRAEAALLFRMDDDGARVVCAHGSDMLGALGSRAGLLDPSVVAAASGHLVVAEPSPGSVGQSMIDRVTRERGHGAVAAPASALLVPIQVHGRLFGFVELTKSAPFQPREVVKAEDLALAFARHVSGASSPRRLGPWQPAERLIEALLAGCEC